MPIYGSAAPGFHVRSHRHAAERSRRWRAIPNPVPADSAFGASWPHSVPDQLRRLPRPAGLGNGPVVKYGMFPPAIGAAANPAAGYTDGYIFGIIRNGKGLMPSYNRIEEPDRWDIVNYCGRCRARSRSRRTRRTDVQVRRERTFRVPRRWDRRVPRRTHPSAAAAPAAAREAGDDGAVGLHDEEAGATAVSLHPPNAFRRRRSPRGVEPRDSEIAEDGDARVCSRSAR